MNGALSETSVVEISQGDDFTLHISTVHIKMSITPEFISIGGNRNPAAADWDQNGSNLLAFGADNCIALWQPSVCLLSLMNHSLSRDVANPM